MQFQDLDTDRLRSRRSTTGASIGCTTPNPIPALADAASYWPRGKVIGGSSSINAMVYIRGQKSDFDDWAALGNDGWAFERRSALFQEVRTL
jgi:choline dehydrogenase-like flavoprotein